MNKTPSLFRKPPAARDPIRRIRIPVLLAAILAGLFPPPSCAESVVVQWEKIYNGPGNGGDSPAAVAVDSAGNVIVAGASANTSGNSDYYTAKYAATDGELLWEKRYNGPLNRDDGAAAMVVDSAGNAIVTGSSFPIPPTYIRTDYYTAKYTAAGGALLWEKRYNGPNGSDEASAVAVDSEGNVIVTGSSSREEIPDSPDWYTAKYAAANGALLWEKRQRPAGANGWPRALALDSAGNAFVTGVSYAEVDGKFNVDYYTAKYAATNGALLWERRYNGPGNDSDDSGSVAVDSEGNAIVTGLSTGSGGNIDFYTAKYAAANGALIWEKRYNGTGNGDDRAVNLAVDSTGNAIVFGPSTGSGGNSDLYTAKYAAANGALIWEKRYNGTGNGDDQPRKMVVDGAGNVFVTGSSYSSGGNKDIYTAKYAAADGTLLWEMLHNGTGNLNDYGIAVTVDTAGNVIVTGSSTNSSGNSDFYTVKYAPVDLDIDDDGLLDSWEVAHFGNITEHSALDDTDGDGRVELLELAFGADPLMPDAGATPAVIVEGGYLTTTITKHPGVTYLVQTSPRPDAGFSATSTTVLTDNATTLKVRDNVLLGTQPARFLRVHVTAAP